MCGNKRAKSTYLALEFYLFRARAALYCQARSRYFTHLSFPHDASKSAKCAESEEGRNAIYSDTRYREHYEQLASEQGFLQYKRSYVSNVTSWWSCRKISPFIGKTVGKMKKKQSARVWSARRELRIVRMQAIRRGSPWGNAWLTPRFIEDISSPRSKRSLNRTAARFNSRTLCRTRDCKIRKIRARDLRAGRYVRQSFLLNNTTSVCTKSEYR